MKKQTEPSDEMPELDDERFRRPPKRGHHAQLSVGSIVAIDPEIWAHFGSSKAINEALRRVVADEKNAAGS